MDRNIHLGARPQSVALARIEKQCFEVSRHPLALPA